MASAVVQFVDLARGGFVFVEKLTDGVVESLRQDKRLGVAGLGAEILQRHGDGEEFAERIPAEMVLGVKLLYVLGCGATGARLEQTATGEQGYDGEHLGAGAEFQNRKEIGEVIAQYVAGDGH